MRKTVILLVAFVFASVSFSCCADPVKDELRVLQMNLWAGTTNVPGSGDSLAAIISSLNPDIVLFCEAVSRGDTSLVTRTAASLSEAGQKYYVAGAGRPVCMMTRYEPLSQEWTCIVPGNEERAMLKVILNIEGKEHAVYSAHIDHRNYACYQPRGYDGATWKKIDAPVTDEAEVLAANRKSFRDESIRAFLEEAKKDSSLGRTVIIGGDFNEPSHLDWGENTSSLWDHNGAVVHWDCSMMLLGAGFTDSFRQIHPDPVACPGFTFPAGNADARKAGKASLSWAPLADERDRIDFVYYQSPDSSFEVKESWIVGPAATVLRDSIVPDEDDSFVITPDTIWPSDHRGNLVVFSLGRWQGHTP